MPRALGPPQKDSFQNRCTNALKAQSTFSDLVSELKASGWDEADADRLAKDLQGALNRAALVMQRGRDPVPMSLCVSGLRTVGLLLTRMPRSRMPRLPRSCRFCGA